METFEILLKNININDDKTDELSGIYTIYEKIKTYEKFNAIYKELKDFFLIFYKIHNVKASLFNKKTEEFNILYHNGKEFKNNDSLTFNFPIMVSKNRKVTFSINCENTEHKEDIKESKVFLDLLFYMIEPVIKCSFLHEDLKSSSLMDHLTCVYNRKFLLAHLNKMIPLAKRESKNVGFLIVGVDHFKAVIDEFDYEIGDKVLIELAEVLKENVRESDIVVRLNADEFLVVLANVDTSDSAIKVAQKLIDSFSKVEVDVNSYTGQTLKKTICIGLSMYPEDSTSVDQIMKNADMALYEAKNMGRSKVLKYENDTATSIELF